MARLKFLLFALPALGVLGWQLTQGSLRTADLAVHDAQRLAAGARPVFQAHLDEARLRLEALLVRGATTWSTLPQASQHGGLKGESLAAAFKSLRTGLQEGVPEGQKDALTLILSSNGNTLVARGDAEPAESADGLSVEGPLGAGNEGAIVDAFNTPHQFYAVALSPEEKSGVTLALGVPLISWDVTDAVARETGLAGVGLVDAGKLIAAAGPLKASLKGLAQSKGAGVPGAMSEVGPLHLPWTGGEGPYRAVAARGTLPGTKLEVLALASVEQPMSSLASAQKRTGLALGVLGLLALIVLVTMRSPPAPGMSLTVTNASARRSPEERSMQRAETQLLEALEAPQEETTEESGLPTSGETGPEEFDFSGLGNSQLSTLPPPPVPTGEMPALGGDDASLTDGMGWPAPPAPGFSASPGVARHDTPPVPAQPPLRDEDPYPPDEPELGPSEFTYAKASPLAAQPPVPPPAAVTPRMGLGDIPSYVREPPPAESEQRTTIAEPGAIFGNPAPDTAASPGFSGFEDEPREGEYNPDATRVASVPAELIAQSARNEHTTTTVPAASAMSSVSLEESHFQSVYRDFVTTRERCGESADGLTYDRFAQKLRKNRDQLMQKYACKTVRFQVYIKEGKAALKATPVRE